MMSKILKVAMFLTITSGVFWTIFIAMIEGAGGLEVLALFLMIFALQAIGFLVGLWAYWKHPGERRTATWLLGLPLAFYFLPGIVKSLAGGHLTGYGLVVLLVLVLGIVLIACLFVPRKVASRLPDFLFRSRFVNSLILVGPVLGWLFMIGVLVWTFGVEGEATSRSLRNDSTGHGLGAAIAIGAIYLAGLGGGSLLVGAWAWMGLRSGVAGSCRKLNVAQLTVATPGLLLGACALFFMLSQS